MTLALNSYQTMAVGILLYYLGKFLKARIKFLRTYCIPNPVIGGILFRRQRAHRVRPQNLERRAHGQRPAASGARLVAEEELVVSDVLGIDGHGYRPLSDRASADSARDPSAPRCALRSG